MTLKERAASLDPNSVLSILVKFSATGTEQRHRVADWESCAYMDCEVDGEHTDEQFNETVFIVTSHARLERGDGEGTLFYIDDDGQKYEIGSLHSGDRYSPRQTCYDMGIIMKWFETEDAFGYELIDYFMGIECLPDDEIIDTCHYYIQKWKNRKNI